MFAALLPRVHSPWRLHTTTSSAGTAARACCRCAAGAVVVVRTCTRDTAGIGPILWRAAIPNTIGSYYCEPGSDPCCVVYKPMLVEQLLQREKASRHVDVANIHQLAEADRTQVERLQPPHDSVNTISPCQQVGGAV